MTAFLLTVLMASSPPGDDSAAHLILERRCIQCHDAAEKKGGLSLERRADAMLGGDSGPVINIGQPNQSVLWQQISGPNPSMPQGTSPLSESELATIGSWIARGAAWPEAPLRDRRHEVSNWWSLQPLVRPTVPVVASAHITHSNSVTNQEWATVHPVDAFLETARLKEGLTASPEADRVTLIRRLSFDLLGLPPQPDAVESFLSDKEPDAYERLVSRLLDHPAYGERWARHWLDVVHFGETHGYDKDQPRLNAWPYRDYVIRAFNEDRPYSRFIEEQLAGDMLYPGSVDGIEGLGFIAAGPWDLIGHAEVPETKIDGKIARHLDRDDMVTNTIQTFCSLTIQCAQCHNHKFDPITQEDYYALQAVFAAVDRTNRSYDRDPVTSQKRLILAQQLSDTQGAISDMKTRVTERAGVAMIELDQRIAELEKHAATPDQYPVEFGYHSEISAQPNAEKWVQVELPNPQEIREIVLRPCHDDFNGIGAGFGFPLAFRVEIADDSALTINPRLVHSQTLANPRLDAIRIPVSGTTGRVIRVTATKLAPRMNDYIFSMAELEVLDVQGVDLARGVMVSALDSIEAGPRWRRQNLTDGLFPESHHEITNQLAKLQVQRQDLWNQTITDDEEPRWNTLHQTRESVQREIASLPAQSIAYIGAVHTGSGAFVGTGASGGQPRPVHRLARGNVSTPLEEVGPGAISAVTTLASRFVLGEGHSEGARRAALALWISSPDNPLTWRSAANRVWQYHFGHGLVDTANDFGRNGGTPSHPELLDWLACELREHQSLKRLHLLIVTSAAYRQSSQSDPVNSEVDSENRWLWRMNRRRLEAEPFRDSVLATAGLLNTQMYGPSFQEFVVEKPEHSPHYEYHLHDPRDPACFRRSIYRFLVRSQPDPFMASLDCADPSMQVEKRNESVSPLQALSLWNDAFMLTAADLVQARSNTSDQPLEQQVADAWLACFSREIDNESLQLLSELARSQGMNSVWRVLWNSNQFIFVE